jgi:hypothetical protein
MAAHENSLPAGRGITEYQGLCCTCGLGVEKKHQSAALGRSVFSEEEHQVRQNISLL